MEQRAIELMDKIIRYYKREMEIFPELHVIEPAEFVDLRHLKSGYMLIHNPGGPGKFSATLMFDDDHNITFAEKKEIVTEYHRFNTASCFEDEEVPDSFYFESNEYHIVYSPDTGKGTIDDAMCVVDHFIEVLKNVRV